MKPANRHTKIASKGDRLKWTPLKEAKSIKLTSDLTKGKRLNAHDLSKAKNSNLSNHNVFVP